MPLYLNPDFAGLPSGAAAIFGSGCADSFFALPEWYDLMARCGVPCGTETRLYTDERAGSQTALVLQVASTGAGRRLAGLANAYSVEHGVVCGPGADLEQGLAAILGEILSERPRWDCLGLSELDPLSPGWHALLRSLRRAGFLVERVFHSGTWYEETSGLDFADYLAARPSPLRHTWARKKRRIEANGRLEKAFFADMAGIDAAVADYRKIYAASWKPEEAFPDLIPALIRLAAGLGTLRLGICYIDGAPAAAQFWILWRGRAVIYKLAHDRRFDDLSLGTLLTMEMIERVLTRDRPHEINFGRGDDAYKKLWLPKRRERWGIVAANPRTIRGACIGVEREAAKLYRRLHGERSMPVG